MLKKLRLIYKNFFQINKILSLMFILISLIIVISLISYNKNDFSYFYYNSNESLISNKLGSLGANIAATMFYIFGLNAFVVAIFCMYLAKFYYKNLNFKKEWEIFFSFTVLILNLSILASVYNFNLYSINAGVLGRNLHKILISFFKQERIIVVFVTSFLWISLILISRLWVISLLKPLSRYLINFENKISQVLHNFAFNISLILKNYLLYFVSFFNFKNNESQEKLLKDEYINKLKTENIDLQDNFWNEYKKNDELEKIKDFENLNPSDLKEVDLKEAKLVNKTEKVKYILPDLKTFQIIDNSKDASVIKELESLAQILEEKLKRFGVQGSVVAIAPGPVITLFEYQPTIDTKISKIIALEYDLSMALQATSIRIIAPIPGKSVVGFEVANKTRTNVYFANMIQSNSFKKFQGHLPLILGEDTLGNKIVSDLVRMPHLLVAGSTGSGKSVALNAIISGLLCKCSPKELKLILIDPKRLEFAQYTDIAHLLFPIVTIPKHASPVLRWVVQEMESRYETMSQVGVKNIFEYNEYCIKNNLEKNPFIVVIIDELADLMMTAGKEVEDLIVRIAQMARASGIHMIVATQRPSVDVITGLIKINFPCRIAFRVASKIDSRIILDTAGADKLLGKGDMLLLDSNSPYVKRVHAPYIEPDEINKIVNHIRQQSEVKYLDLSQVINTTTQEGLAQDDEIYSNVIDFLNEIDEVSISLLQRKFRIGYNRSARIIEMLESHGHIFPMDGGKTRKVIKNNKL